MVRRVAVASVVVVMSLFFGGCGGETSGGVETPAAPAASVTVPGGGTFTTGTAFDPQDALLDLPDFPAGWIRDPDPAPQEGACGSRLLQEATTTARAAFSEQGSVPAVQHSVGAFSPAAATVAMQETRKRLAGCSTYESGGVSWTVSEVAVPDVGGDEQIPFLIRGEHEGFQLVGLAVAVRVGDGVTTFSYADLGDIDIDEAVGYLRQATARLRQVQP